MSAGPVRAWQLDELPPSDAATFRAEVAERVRGGARPITLFGRKDDDAVLVTAVLQGEGGALHASRARIDPAEGWRALTSELPALHAFERELHEQHGVQLAGHPWLKPIRFERGGREARDAYPFHRVEGKEVHEVAVGPIHAGVIEPGSFRFMCHGERVHHLEIHLGYQHRGVEAMLLRGDPRTRAPLVETIAGDTSIGHTWAYAAAIEALAGFVAGPEINVPRGVMLELERIAMHLAGLSGMAADVGFLQGASTYGRLRTTAINTTMRLCGSRFGRGAIRPGGLGAELDGRAGTAEGDHGSLSLGALRRNLTLLRTDLAIIDDCFLGARTVQHRLQGVGRVSEELAREIGLVGPAARACGVPLDQRSVTPVVESTGDCWARARMRIREIQQSLDAIESALERRPHWDRSRATLGPLAPCRLVVSVGEGWRGEIVHALETDERGALVHYKVQDPSLRNWLGLALAVRDEEISDFPICNKSFDLSYCGNDL